MNGDLRSGRAWAEVGGRRGLLVSVTLLASVGCGLGDEAPYFIRGTARLPDCTEAPSGNITGRWFDLGTVNIDSDGCDPYEAGDAVPACALNWDLEQDGNDVEILVDFEYEIRGRFCGDTLHLEGGWWLPVQNEVRGCTYEEDDAAEVVIDEEGATLTYDSDAPGTRLFGVLAVRAGCTARYDVELMR